ncbi:MAG TPA: hypothetical protein VF400_09090, partial [Anaeromyxobacteraceae bacterium]
MRSAAPGLWHPDPRRAALAAALLLGLALVRQLYTSGAPLFGIRGPWIYPLAALAALAVAAWALPGGWRRAPVAAGALAL